MVKETVEVRGYTLPEGAMVLASLYNTMRDESVFMEPEIFRPERWLDVDNLIQKPSSFMPYSIGKRACLGADLARLELFVMGGSLLQKFNFHMEDPCSPPSLEPYMGVTMLPRPFKMKVTRC